MRRALSVIVAVQHAESNVPAVVRALKPERHAEVEFLFVFAGSPTGNMPAGDNVHCITASRDALIPVMWRDGIMAAHGQYVAITTAHCIPAPDWLATCLQMEFPPGCSAVGGVIENVEDANARSRAVFFQRYMAYAPPQRAREVEEVAADNAVYRRSEILAHRDLLRAGFWEPGFHHEFRAAGQSLRMEPALRVVHHNQYSTVQFVRQRLAHGRNFGRARGRQLTIPGCLLRLFSSPLIPLVLLARITGQIRRHGGFRGQLGGALPWLMCFLVAWGAGEASGYLSALMRANDHPANEGQ